MEEYLNEELVKPREKLNEKAEEYFELVNKIQSDCKHLHVGQIHDINRICLNCGLIERLIKNETLTFETLTSEFHKPLTNGEWEGLQEYFLNPIGMNRIW